MKLIPCWAAAVAALGTAVHAQSSSSSSSSSNTVSAPAAQSTVCGDIIRQVDDAINPNRLFNASTVRDCLNSVPFNPAVATRFLKYVNDTILFQSSLGSIKSPPPGYQRPGVDLVAGINMMQELTNRAQYKSHYEFEDHLNTLLSSAHDNHLNFYTFGASAFRFIAPHQLVSYSQDGKALPRLYLARDAYDYRYSGGELGQGPSPIKTINGKPAEEYLNDFSTQHSAGNLDPHADWNELMYHPYLELQSRNEIFRASTSYSGDELTFVLENGTQVGPEPFQALYTLTVPTGPLETGGDFFNFFVLGYYPASFDPETSDTDYYRINATDTINNIYAHKTASDPDDPVGRGALGTVGYDLPRPGFNNYSVIFIPGFDAVGKDIANFSETLYSFFNDTLKKNQHRVLIDLQQNTGGSPILAIDTFRHFFPNNAIEPSFRMRANKYANTIGTQFSAYWQKLDYDTSYDDFYVLEPSLFVAQNRIDPRTGQNFSSWSDFYGPRLVNGDFVTNTQRYNVSDSTFTTFSQSYPEDYFSVYGSGNASLTPSQPFDAQDILILTDGLCNSACALFVELMHYYAGVRTITIGGKPQYGPMQTSGRTRGGSRYSLETLDFDFNATAFISEGPVPASIDLPERDPGLLFQAASVNALDVMREGSDVGLHFTFDAADCRLFHTPDTIFEYAEVWYAAINATWMDTSRCVQGSTGFSTRKGQPATKPAPAIGQQGPTTFDQAAVEIGARIPDNLADLTNSGLDSGATVNSKRIAANPFTFRLFQDIKNARGQEIESVCKKHNLVTVIFESSVGHVMCTSQCKIDDDCASTNGVTTNNCDFGNHQMSTGFAGGGSTPIRAGTCLLNPRGVQRSLKSVTSDTTPGTTPGINRPKPHTIGRFGGILRGL